MVNPSVLIPRMETETLVEYIIEKSEIRNPKSEIRILDLGTGCGNIAIILAKRLNCKVYATDISDEALCSAKRNAKMHGVSNKIKFIKSDWFTNLDTEPVDIIVSNPPYISEEEWWDLPMEVRNYEPRIALWGGKGGLGNYKKIISCAKGFLKPGGRIIFEIGYNQAESVKELLGDFQDIEVVMDCYGNPRVIGAIVRNFEFPARGRCYG